jgi:hypothetical protein
MSPEGKWAQEVRRWIEDQEGRPREAAVEGGPV